MDVKTFVFQTLLQFLSAASGTDAPKTVDCHMLKQTSKEIQAGCGWTMSGGAEVRVLVTWQAKK